MRKSRLYLGALVVLSVLTAAYQGVFAWHDAEPSGAPLSLSHFLFGLLLVLWVDADSEHRANVYRPFDFGWLVFLFWIPYLPFYLWRTRRGAGLIMLLGFAMLFFLGAAVDWIVQLVR